MSRAALGAGGVDQCTRSAAGRVLGLHARGRRSTSKVKRALVKTNVCARCQDELHSVKTNMCARDAVSRRSHGVKTNMRR